jgi:hypothetical protein
MLTEALLRFHFVECIVKVVFQLLDAVHHNRGLFEEGLLLGVLNHDRSSVPLFLLQLLVSVLFVQLLLLHEFFLLVQKLLKVKRPSLFLLAQQLGLLVFECTISFHALKDIGNDLDLVLLDEVEVLGLDVVVFNRHKHLVDEFVGPLIARRLIRLNLVGLEFLANLEIASHVANDGLVAV